MDRRAHREAESPQQIKKESQRVRHFLIKVSLVYVLFSTGLFFLFSHLLKEHAYDDMSRGEIHHISQMVFESMYTAMLTGSGKAGIDAASKRMSKTGPGMLISVIRGEVVAEMFKEDKIDKMRRLNDLAIFDVFKTGQEQMIHKDQRMRFLYPALFNEQCKQCHTNAKSGQVAAVVEIIYPISDLKVSTNYVDKLMLAYFSVSFFMLIMFINITYRRR
jgi:hypothetical protein